MKKIILIGIIALLLIVPASAMIESESQVKVTIQSNTFVGFMLQSIMPFFATGLASHPWMCENTKQSYGVSTDMQCDGTKSHCLDFCCAFGDSEACTLLVSETDSCSQNNDCIANFYCNSGNCLQLSCYANQHIDNHQCVYNEEIEEINNKPTIDILSPPDNEQLYEDTSAIIKIRVWDPNGDTMGVGLNIRKPDGIWMNVQPEHMTSGTVNIEVDIQSDVTKEPAWGTYQYYVVVTDWTYDVTSEMRTITFNKDITTTPPTPPKYVPPPIIPPPTTTTYWCLEGQTCYERTTYTSNCYIDESSCEASTITPPTTKEVWIIEERSCQKVDAPLAYTGGYSTLSTCEAALEGETTKEVWVIQDGSCRKVVAPLAYTGGYSTYSQCNSVLDSLTDEEQAALEYPGTTGTGTSWTNFTGTDTGIPALMWIIAIGFVVVIIITSGKKRRY